jgi:hypothetical protein
MQKILTLSASLFALLLNAQEIPKKIEIPPVHADPNVQFTVLHFDAPAKDQFSILYYYQVNGSVLRSGEFVRDTGGVVFKDKLWNEPIENSTGAILFKRQVVDASGKELSAEQYLLAKRALGGEGTYKLFFQKKGKDPVVTNRTEITKSVYNVMELPNMTDGEKSALVKFCSQYIPVKTDKHTGQVENPTTNRPPEKTVVDDWKSMKNQFKAIREARSALRTDMPKDEKVLTRFTISGNRSFAITKTKGDNAWLKCYLSEDDKQFECLDSTRINGDIQITSTAVVYSTKPEAVGAFANFLYEFKDEKGEKLNRQLTVAMDADFRIGTWIHSTGKDKLNSISPELCWYDGDKLYLMSNNRDKIFKPYAQVHEFIRGGAAKILYPATDEEKGTEKFQYTKNFQPPAPMNTSLPPVPDRHIPVQVLTRGSTRYFMSQGVKRNEAMKADEYLSMTIYRFENGTRLTNIDVLGDYRGNKPFPLEHLTTNDAGEYFLILYPIRVQLAFTPEKSEVTQLTDDRTYLVEKSDGAFIQHTPNGSMLLRKEAIGNKMTVLYYR